MTKKDILRHEGERGGEMSCKDVFQHLVDEIYRVLKKNGKWDPGIIIKEEDFDKDVPGVDGPDSKVVFHTSTDKFGDGYGGIVLCGSVKDRPERPRAPMSVSVVSLNDMANPKKGYTVLVDDMPIDDSEMSFSMVSSFLQYVFVDFFFRYDKPGRFI